MDMSSVTETLQLTFEKMMETPTTTGMAVAGGVILLSGFYILLRPKNQSIEQEAKIINLAGGKINRGKIKNAYQEYSTKMLDSQGESKTLTEKHEAANLVQKFYNLITCMYETFWSESFHFCVPLAGKPEKAAEVAHEARIACLCGLKPGMKCLDVGCGVGGPMRTIASFSGANIVGINYSEYQVDRLRYHNKRFGIEGLCSAVFASYLDMPFEDNSFDAAYAIEALCHAVDIHDPYREVFRVLKPGSMFVAYNWLYGHKYNPNNPQHVRDVEQFYTGNGLFCFRTIDDCLAAAKKTGFEIIDHYDVNRLSEHNQPWHIYLDKVMGVRAFINRRIVNTLSFFRLLPAGVKQVHDMLLDAAAHSKVCAENGLWTPMHVTIYRKPLTPSTN